MAVGYFSFRMSYERHDMQWCRQMFHLICGIDFCSLRGGGVAVRGILCQENWAGGTGRGGEGVGSWQRGRDGAAPQGDKA